MPVLEILSGSMSGSRVAIDETEIVIGKDPTCAVFLDDPGISRRHASIRKKGTAYVVADLGSSNGTYVNFKRQGENQEVEIDDGDVLFLGRTVAKYYAKGPEAATAVLEQRVANLERELEAARAGAGSGGGGGALGPGELATLLRSTVPIAGLACSSCGHDLQEELGRRVREQEQVEVIRRLGLHQMPAAAIEGLLSKARG